jgi:excisionase family DNA binding protein
MTEAQESYFKLKISELELRIEKLEEDLATAQIISANKSDYFTIKEYADIMQVCTATVYHKDKHGSISAVKVGKSIRIPKNQINKNL